MTLTIREAELRIARIDAAVALGIELSPWGEDIYEQLREYLGNETRSGNRLDDASDSLVEQMSEQVQTLDLPRHYGHTGIPIGPRTVASEWHSGQSSPLYAYSSTGWVSMDLVAEVVGDLSACQPGERLELRTILEAIAVGS